MADAPDAEWFADMARGSQIVFFVMRLQPDVAYEYISDAIGDVMGITAPEILDDPDALHRQLSEDSAETLAAALRTGPGEDVAVKLKWSHRDGSPVYSRCWGRTTQRPDGSVVLEGTVNVITELHEIQTELHRSEERHRLLAENAYDVIWTMAMDGTITYVSPAVQRVRGITPEEASRQTLEEIHPPESAARVADYYQRVFTAIEAGTEPPVFRGEMEYYRADGSIMTGELQVIPHIDSDGQVVELLGVTRDISERKMFESELTRLAVTDPLTGLWNRRHTAELLAADLVQAEQHGQALALLMIDIDHFKAINDTQGHQIGDRVLIEVARRLLGSSRSTDVVGRWGGEEFVVLLRFCGLPEALVAAEKLRRQIGEVAIAPAGCVTVSIGAAELLPGDDINTWLDRADAALYEAKRSGRNAVAS